MNTLQWLLQTIRQIAGMPDYDRYVAHLRTCHPDRPVPDEHQYYDQFLNAKYGGGISRCC